MKEEFEKLVSAGKIKPPDVEPLTELATAGFCMHRSWGFGKITTVDTVFARFTIDFENKPGHSMDLSFAVSSLKPIPREHILARKSTDLAGLQQMAALHHLDLIKLVLESYDGEATADQIRDVLVPDVIADDWKKWWETARREMKKDGHFQLPVKKSLPIFYHQQEVSLQDRLLQQFRAAKGLKAKLPVVQEIEKNIEDLEDPKAAVEEVISALNQGIDSHQRTQPALAIETIFARDDLRNAVGATAQEPEVTMVDIWAQGLNLGGLIGQLPSAKQKRALFDYKEAHPNEWIQPVLEVINHVSTRLAGECAGLLVSENRTDELKTHLAALINQHSGSSDLLLWLAKSRSDSFADILGPEVFRAMLTAIERDQFNERKSARLADFLLDDKDIVGELIDSADIEVIKDLTRALKLSPAFDDMDKRSLLGRIVKSYPTVQSLISGEKPKEQMPLLALHDTMEAKQKEYDNLVHKKIPANSKEIAIARSYGDLRENSEYKYAKEQQRLLHKLKHELERDLDRVRVVSLNTVDPSAIAFGTKVTVLDLETNKNEDITILGPWESNPEQGIVSYQAPLGQALVTHRVGDEIDFEPDPAHRRRFKIEAIKTVVAAEVPSSVRLSPTAELVEKTATNEVAPIEPPPEPPIDPSQIPVPPEAGEKTPPPADDTTPNDPEKQ